MTSLLKQLQPPERVETKIQAHASKSKEAAMRRRGEQPLRQELWRLAGADLTSIDGISPPAALVILTELALDLAAFPSEQQFVSWLRLAP